MKLYLVKVINDNIIEYEFISNNLSINELNNNPKLSYYPRLGKNDKNLIRTLEPMLGRRLGLQL